MRTHFVAVQTRGVLTLPAELRRRYHLDKAGAQVEITEREDGVIEMRPHISIPADQAWFWTEEWRRGEREAEEEIAAGKKGKVHDSTEDFLDSLGGDSQ